MFVPLIQRISVFITIYQCTRHLRHGPKTEFSEVGTFKITDADIT